jgi:hypothetical protein
MPDNHLRLCGFAHIAILPTWSIRIIIILPGFWWMAGKLPAAAFRWDCRKATGSKITN